MSPSPKRHPPDQPHQPLEPDERGLLLALGEALKGRSGSDTIAAVAGADFAGPVHVNDRQIRAMLASGVPEIPMAWDLQEALTLFRFGEPREGLADDQACTARAMCRAALLRAACDAPHRGEGLANAFDIFRLAMEASAVGLGAPAARFLLWIADHLGTDIGEDPDLVPFAILAALTLSADDRAFADEAVEALALRTLALHEHVARPRAGRWTIAADQADWTPIIAWTRDTLRQGATARTGLAALALEEVIAKFTG